jgi:hypothetical protein
MKMNTGELFFEGRMIRYNDPQPVMTLTMRMRYWRLIALCSIS